MTDDKQILTIPSNKRISNIPLKHSRLLRGPSQIAFDITNKCNFRCLHCFNLSGENEVMKNEMSDEEVIRFIEDVARMKLLNLCFCGGEPLLRLELILRSVPILKRYGIGVSMVSNGYLFTKEKGIRLKEAGVNNIQISLDGATPQTHEKLRVMKGSFERAVNALDILSQIGIQSGVAFTPTSFNIHEFPQLYQLCVDLKVRELRVQPTMLLGRSMKYEEEIIPSMFQYRQLVRMIQRLKLRDNKIILEWGDPVDHIIRFRGVCQYCVNAVDVRADGSIIASPYFPMVVGNVRMHSLSEYWEAGLARIWQLQVVQRKAKEVNSVDDFRNQDIYRNQDIVLDIIDEKLL